MSARLSGTRRTAEALEAGARLLGDVRQVAGRLRLRDGDLADLPVCYDLDPDTGFYRHAANQHRSVAGGAYANQWGLGTTVANGSVTVTGTSIAMQRLRRAGDVAFALAAGTSHDLGSAGSSSVLRITPDGAGSAIGGIVGGVDGDELMCINVGAANLSLLHQDAGSAAQNRILTSTGAALVLVPDAVAWLWYDPVATRWRAWLW